METIRCFIHERASKDGTRTFYSMEDLESKSKFIAPSVPESALELIATPEIAKSTGSASMRTAFPVLVTLTDRGVGTDGVTHRATVISVKRETVEVTPVVAARAARLTEMTRLEQARRAGEAAAESQAETTAEEAADEESF